MPVSPLSVLTPDALERFPDLQSVPRHRHFGKHPLIERLRAAVPFDYVFISGLDLDNYRFGSGCSIDTDLPPAYVETYYAEQLWNVDPFALAMRTATRIVCEKDLYAVAPPPERLTYLLETFGIHNRTLFPLLRGNVVYGGVWVTRKTPFSADELDFLSVVAGSIHAAVTRPLMDRFATEELKLSRGEIACLAHAGQGGTSEEIAARTGYQLDTVNSYLKSAIRKLGAANRTHAIAEAIRRRLID
jgi:DNA-binding HTH domain-containing proteins